MSMARSAAASYAATILASTAREPAYPAPRPADSAKVRALQWPSPRAPALRRIALFVALMATAMALGPALAHLFELPNKIGLPADAYFAVQQIYSGWSLFGALLAVQLLSIVAVIVAARTDRRLRSLAVLALACLAGAQALFWIFTYPANAATENWTVRPDDWRILRRQWELSHAAGALLQLAAMACLSIGALWHASDKHKR